MSTVNWTGADPSSRRGGAQRAAITAAAPSTGNAPATPGKGGPGPKAAAAAAIAASPAHPSHGRAAADSRVASSAPAPNSHARPGVAKYAGAGLAAVVWIDHARLSRVAAASTTATAAARGSSSSSTGETA